MSILPPLVSVDVAEDTSEKRARENAKSLFSRAPDSVNVSQNGLAPVCASDGHASPISPDLSLAHLY